MKYTLKAFLILALGCLTYSCLDLDPKDQIADGNYWGEASDFKLFANQFLLDHQQLYLHGPFLLALELDH